MIVVVAEGLSIEDVECLVGEQFMASVTVKAVSVVFSLELSV